MIRTSANKISTCKESEALSKIISLVEKTEKKIVPVLRGKVLVGVITYGDILKALKGGNIEKITAKDVMNHQPETILRGDKNTTKFVENSKHQYIPEIDDQSNFISILENRKGKKYLDVGSKVISEDSDVFFIAEIGNNHNGSLNKAFELIDEATSAGADCIKFQHRNINNLYNVSEGSSNLGTEYTQDLLAKYNLSPDEMMRCFERVVANGKIPLCTPWDDQALKDLESIGFPFYKIASADFTNYFLLDEAIKTGKDLLLSTGMTSDKEIINTLEYLRSHGANYALLHCNSAYPPPYEDLNLRYLENLRQAGDCLVGYSGHERGFHVAVSSIALGAKIIEKHFTLDKSMEGVDHKVSLLPNEFKQLVKQGHDISLALGSSSKRKITQGEKINRINLAKSIFVNKDLEKGMAISAKDLYVKSPGNGIQPNSLLKILGKKLKSSVKKDEMLMFDHLKKNQKKYQFNFNRKWGISVRHRDWEEFNNLFKPEILEFHFSYQDIALDHEKYFKDKDFDSDLIFHAPELFESDHILDLASSNKKYLQKSLSHIKATFEAVNVISDLFKYKKQKYLILNCGGWTENQFLDEFERKKKIEILKKSLNSLSGNEIEILPQTMPPFPWHFGGQRHHNIFTHLDETIEILKELNLKICFDTSHTAMWCNYTKTSLDEYVKSISQFIQHAHISDSKGVTDEGLQIGEGAINFSQLSNSLKDTDFSFIPEIWQGHDNNADGFYNALIRLQGKF